MRTPLELLDVLAVLAVAVLLPALIGAGPPHAESGDASGEVGLDLLRASSSQAGPGAGTPESMVAQEAGIRIRLRARELDRRLQISVDYQGREPIGGDVQDSALRLLYEGAVSYALIERHLVLAAGRFVAPSVVLLPIDGARAEIRVDRLTITPFGGRRAISTSRRNIDFGSFLPAAGVSASWAGQVLMVDGAAGFSRDELVLIKSSTGEDKQTFDAPTGYLRLFVRPIPSLFVGGQAAFAQRAGYTLGPTWTRVQLRVHALDLWNGAIFSEWRPIPGFRLAHDLHTQRAGVFRDGVDVSGGAPVPSVPAVQDPTFTDNRFRVAVRPLDLGWVRAEFRLRVRNDRQERRYGGSVDLDQVAFRGLFLRGALAYEDIAFDAPAGPNLNRMLWSASAGYRIAGFDAEAGGSFIERKAGPISSRLFNPAPPNEPTAPVNLAPFVLEAQRILFARLFYAGELWFAGIDFEQNLENKSEQRLFAQLGVLLEEAW